MGLFNWAKRLPPANESANCPGTSESTNLTQTQPPQSSGGSLDHVRQGMTSLDAGDFHSAVSAFRRALALAPNLATNHVNLAYALQEIGGDLEALSHLRDAVELDPTSFDAHYLLGAALERSNNCGAAAEHLRRAVALRPEFEPARSDLCRLMVANGDLPAARAVIIAALTLNPDNADFHQYLGNICMAESEFEAAVVSYTRALALRPNEADLHCNLGLALHALDDFEGAARCFESALAFKPDSYEIFVNIGRARKAQHRPADAAAAMQRALALEPAHAEALNSLGILFLEQGLLDDAIETFQRGVLLHPEHPSSYVNLGIAHYEKGDAAQAVAAYRQGLTLQPIAELHANLANALQMLGALDEAISHYQKALVLQPENTNIRADLAAALVEGGSPRLAIAAYREILDFKADHLVAHSGLLFNLSFLDDCSAEQYLAEAARFDKKLQRGLLAPPTAESSGPARPLRIGFVSGDLYGHPVGHFLEGVLQHLSAGQLELFAYPTAFVEDELSARIKPRFKGWRLLKGLTDEAAARAIRSDAIDVLIDLAGHTGNNRLAVFALRPAPVQVSWLGYFASTGVTEMDYILADERCVPAGNERFMTEKVWRLPDTRLCYTPPTDAGTPAVAPLPALIAGCVTFGCFQRFPKISDAVLALWGRVFEALPDARLLLQSHQTAIPRFVDQMLQRLADVGITASRVLIRPPGLRAAYLHAYTEVDIVLDTFPYNGGTTTCEALWMGVPTLTLAGDSMLARQGASLLGAAGLTGWVAVDRDEFVAKATAFASDRTGLACLRASLREQVRVSPLFDTQLFARRLETALLAMCEEHLAPGLGKPIAARAAETDAM